jgi:hypothetical protein
MILTSAVPFRNGTAECPLDDVGRTRPNTGLLVALTGGDDFDADQRVASSNDELQNVVGFQAAEVFAEQFAGLHEVVACKQDQVVGQEAHLFGLRAG